MFGRKKPQADTNPAQKTKESSRTTSYRMEGDPAPETSGLVKTTSYVNAMQLNGHGYETLN